MSDGEKTQNRSEDRGAIVENKVHKRPVGANERFRAIVRRRRLPCCDAANAGRLIGSP